VPRRGGDEDYQVKLGDVLRTRDPAALRDFLELSASRYGDDRQVEAVERKSDEEMEEMLHRMILARQDLAELHADSRRWMFEHGMDTYGPGGRRRN
jgi:hypothetical protein